MNVLTTPLSAGSKTWSTLLHLKVTFRWLLFFISFDMTKPILVYDSGRIDDSLSFPSWPASSTSTSSSGNTLTSSFSSGESTSYKKIAEKLQIRKNLRIFAAMITYNINFLLKWKRKKRRRRMRRKSPMKIWRMWTVVNLDYFKRYWCRQSIYRWDFPLTKCSTLSEVSP